MQPAAAAPVSFFVVSHARWLFAALTSLVACTPSTPMLPATAGASLLLAARRPEPGRYATHVWSSGTRTCSGGWAHHDATASLVLNIEADASVTACRGIRQQWSAGSRLSNVDDRFGGELQLGMSGRWRRKGHWLQLELNRDDSVCAPIRSGTPDDTETSWTLRCTELVDTSRSATPMIACQSVEADPDSGLAVHDVLPGAWVIAAAGHGVHVVERADHLGPSRTTVQAATTRVEHGSWRTTPSR